MTQKSKADGSADTKREKDKSLKKLRSRDKVGVTGEILAVAIGILAGVFGAGAIATALGISTLLGSTVLAGFLGGIFVTKTPVGGVIGAAIAGGVVAYGVARLVRSGAWQDKTAGDIADRVEAKERAAHATLGEPDAELLSALEQAAARRLLSEMDRQRLIDLTTSGKMSVQTALERVRALLAEPTEERVPEIQDESTEASAASIQTRVSDATRAGIRHAKSGGKALAQETRQFAGVAKGKMASGLSSAGSFLKAKIAAARRTEKSGE